MKPAIFLAVICCYVTGYAQNCAGYYFLQNNKTIEMAIYNKKGQEQGRQIYSVSDVNNSGSITTASLKSEMFDKKGKLIGKGDSKIQCNGGVFMIDMKMSMPQQQAEQFKEAEMKASDFYQEYPASMNVGDQLKDAEMHLEMETGGLKQTVDMEVTDRKVEAKENVTTPAGTWECFKISYKGKMRIKIGIGIPVNVEGVEWFAPGFGIVKTETKHGSTAIVAVK